MASGRLNHIFFLEVEPEGRYHITPLQLLTEKDREQIPAPWPWLNDSSTPQELRRLTVAVPIMLTHTPQTMKSSTQRPIPLRLGYHPLSSGSKQAPSHHQPTYP